MTTKIGSKALVPNPALKPFEVLIGEWQTTGTHPYFPDTTLQGRSVFEWSEGGAFLLMHSEIDHPNFPSGVAVFGSDDAAKQYFMLYFDERTVSRKYDVSLKEHQFSWWRDDSDFSQRCTITIVDGGNRLVTLGEMSQKGAAWEKDLSQVFDRVVQ